MMAFMPYAENAGTSLYYETQGRGPTVVFAHGAGGNAAIWWQQIPAFLDAGYATVAFDHRGFARSPVATDRIETRHFADDLVAILDAAGVERAALVCQSMGGWTGVQMALQHPDRVRALVLSGTPGGIMTSEVAKAIASLGERLGSTGATLTGPGGAALAPGFYERKPALALLYDQIAAFNVALGPTPVGKIDVVPVDPSALDGWSVPTLVVSGSEDALFPPDALRSVADAIPKAELAAFEGSGHSPYFEMADGFNRVVLEFLKKSARP